MSDSGANRLKRALITGITGQDGSYLAELLLGEGYEVHGLVRRVALEDPRTLSRIAGIFDRITLHAASLESFPSLYAADRPGPADEVYHLASQSFVSHRSKTRFHLSHQYRRHALYSGIGAAGRAVAGCTSPAPAKCSVTRPLAAKRGDAVFAVFALRRLEAHRIPSCPQLSRGLWHVRVFGDPFQS